METSFAPMQTLTQSRKLSSSFTSSSRVRQRWRSLNSLGALAAPIILLTFISHCQSAGGLVRGAQAAAVATSDDQTHLVCPRGFFLQQDDQTCKRKCLSPSLPTPAPRIPEHSWLTTSRFLFPHIACQAGCQKCSDSSSCDACAPIQGAFAYFDEASFQCALGCTGEGCRRHTDPTYTFNHQLLDDSEICLKGYTYSATHRTCLKYAHPECRQNVLTLEKQRGDGTSALALAGDATEGDNQPATFTYYLNAPEWSYTPRISHSELGCSMSCQLREAG